MYYYPSGNANYMMPQSQTYQGFQQTPQTLKGRPVSSVDEVRAAQIDFDGSLFFFPDLAHNRIYTKQISLDGNPSFQMYELTQMPTAQSVETANFVTREEFESVINQFKEALTKPQEAKSEQGKTETPFSF